MRLKAEHIEHFYAQEHILHDINLEIKSSCITAIVGERDFTLGYYSWFTSLEIGKKHQNLMKENGPV
ncbi:MAG: hypothetical protein P8Y43_04310 [Sulfurovaceae bacterium]